GRREQAQDARLARRQVHVLARRRRARGRARVVRRRLRRHRPLPRQRRARSEDGHLTARGAAGRRPRRFRRENRPSADRLGRGHQRLRHRRRQPQRLSRVRAARLQRAAHPDLGARRQLPAGRGPESGSGVDAGHDVEPSAEAGRRVPVRATALSIGKRYETTDPLDPDGVVRRDTLDWLVGVDYTFFERVDTALQLSQKVLMGSATNLTRPGVAAPVTTSVALRVTTGFFDNTLTPTLLFVVGVNRGDFRLSPRIDYLLSQ